MGDTLSQAGSWLKKRVEELRAKVKEMHDVLYYTTPNSLLPVFERENQQVRQHCKGTRWRK